MVDLTFTPFETKLILVNSITNGGFFDVIRVKFPSMSVTTPVDSPTILTLAPKIDCYL
jgi:hypothetical protein